MKKLIFSLAFTMGMATASYAQTSDPQKNIVKVNAVGLLAGIGSFAYERALSESGSIVIAPSVGFINPGDYKYSIVGVGLEYRFYLKKNAPQGIYVAPGAAFYSGTAKDKSSGDKFNVTALSGKAIIGHQWIWNSKFILDLNGGLNYINFKFKENVGATSEDAFGGLLPALGVSFGFNF